MLLLLLCKRVYPLGLFAGIFICSLSPVGLAGAVAGFEARHSMLQGLLLSSLIVSDHDTTNWKEHDFTLF